MWPTMILVIRDFRFCSCSALTFTDKRSDGTLRRTAQSQGRGSKRRKICKRRKLSKRGRASEGSKASEASEVRQSKESNRRKQRKQSKARKEARRVGVGWGGSNVYHPSTSLPLWSLHGTLLGKNCGIAKQRKEVKAAKHWKQTS